MRSYRVEQLIQYLQATIGTNANTDLMYRWVEEALVEIYSQPWSWNWKVISGITNSALTEAAGTFTWTTGQNYLTCSSPMSTIGFSHTGRKVKLGTRWYQTIDIGLTNTSRVYVNRPIVTTESTGISLTFYRDFRYFKTSRIRNVSCGDLPKLGRFDSNDLRKFYLLADTQDYDEGEPNRWQDLVVERMSAPAFPPTYASSGAGSFTNGKYYYFFTKYDEEAELESEPGPTVEVNITDTRRPNMTYANPSGDKLESTSYKMRLYRSEMISATDVRPRTRVPMYLVQQRNPSVPGSPFTDTDTQQGKLRGNAEYWDGTWSGVKLMPKPDSSTYRFDVECLADWGERLRDEHYVKLGKGDEIMQLLRLFLAGVSRLTNLDSKEYRTSLIAFRGQLAHLVTAEREPGNSDPGPRNIHNYSTEQYGTGDWVDWLQSPWGNG